MIAAKMTKVKQSDNRVIIASGSSIFTAITVMPEQKSFRVSDFSLRDVPWAIAAYLVISVFSIGLGVFLESLSVF